MAYMLYRHIKGKRSGSEKLPKPIQLCEHQRDIALDTLSLPTNLSGFSTTPQPVSSGPKVAGNELQVTEDVGPCVLCKEEKHAATKYRWKLIAGLFFPFSVQALDTTIVAGALPFIASDFSESPSTLDDCLAEAP